MPSQAFVIPTAVSQAIDFTAESAKAASTGQVSNYQITADFISECFASGQMTGIHLTLVKAQDACNTGPAWKIWKAGIVSGLKVRGLVLQTTRNIASGKGAFTVASIESVKQAKAKSEKAQQALADTAAAESAAAAAAADASVTAADLVTAMLSEASRLGIDMQQVRDEVWHAFGFEHGYTGVAMLDAA